MNWSLEYRLGLLGNVVSGRDYFKGPARWLRRELVSTPAARGRLRAWALAGGLHKPVPDGTDVRFCGDVCIQAAAAMALNMMAPPAREYVVKNTFVVGAGHESDGFAMLFPARPAKGQRARLVVLTKGLPDNDPGALACAVRQALHEFAHVWLESDQTFIEIDPVEIAERRRLLWLNGSGNYGSVRYTKKQSAVELRAWSLVERWEGQPFGCDFWRSVRETLTIDREECASNPDAHAGAGRGVPVPPKAAWLPAPAALLNHSLGKEASK